MKKLAYLFVFIIALTSLVSCGASGTSTVSTGKYHIKNIKFENQDVVISKEFMESDDVH